MSVSKDEMRAAIYKNWACHKNRTRVDFQMFQAVFALIEHGTEVSRGFVVNSARAMHVEPEALRICLEEAGVTVKEVK